MGVVWDANRRNQTSQLIDSTLVGEWVDWWWNAVIGIHEGKEGFFTRSTQIVNENRNWNRIVMKNNSIHFSYLGERYNLRLELVDGRCCTIKKSMKWMWLFVPLIPKQIREFYSEESQQMPVVVCGFKNMNHKIDAFGALWMQTYATLSNSCVQQECKEGWKVSRRGMWIWWLFDVS